MDTNLNSTTHLQKPFFVFIEPFRESLIGFKICKICKKNLWYKKEFFSQQIDMDKKNAEFEANYGDDVLK
jgi:hypothetical protein